MKKIILCLYTATLLFLTTATAASATDKANECDAFVEQVRIEMKKFKRDALLEFFLILEREANKNELESAYEKYLEKLNEINEVSVSILMREAPAMGCGDLSVDKARELLFGNGNLIKTNPTFIELLYLFHSL